MARKKLIPTWVAVAAVAALFVPYKVEIDKDDNERIKKVTTNSIAVRLSYTPARDGKERDLSAVVPGFTASKCKVKAGKKTYTVDGEQLMRNAKIVCNEVAEKVKTVAKRTAEGVITVNESETEPIEEEVGEAYYPTCSLQKEEDAAFAVADEDLEELDKALDDAEAAFEDAFDELESSAE